MNLSLKLILSSEPILLIIIDIIVTNVQQLVMLAYVPGIGITLLKYTMLLNITSGIAIVTMPITYNS